MSWSCRSRKPWAVPSSPLRKNSCRRVTWVSVWMLPETVDPTFHTLPWVLLVVVVVVATSETRPV